MMTQNIRNFCIIAHIDHGKSTLADCLLVATNAISSRDIKPQVLDDMELERERGITIRSKTVRLDHRTPDGDDYILNLIDTPGHVDFSYEVSRGIIASEGVLMLVDATQGVEAQTLSHCMTARKHGVRIIPIINKIDLATADVERTAGQIRDVLHLDEKPLEISAKEGVGVDDVLEAIVQRIPPPEGSSDAPLKAVVFDSFYDAYRGVVVYLRLIDGCVRPGMKIAFLSSGRTYEVLETGV
ncbi:MAG: GTP-binding protein, partial [Elusimicrobia bacterium]|nr:GTP-binding protein [Elusimicrobiota bacterium]